MTARARHAVYWAPPSDHPLWRAGGEWLQRDGAEQPRRYGFHATLKAPMALRSGATVQAFGAAVERLAAHVHDFDMPPLQVAWLNDFMCLRPATALADGHPLRRLCDACVHDLDAWRAPLSDDELQRRIAAGALSPPQQELLRRWGYPHVFGHWRFHMTLSNPLPADASLRERWTEAAQRHFGAALAAPLRCESICVFTEPAPRAAFELAQRVALAA
ncbi:MAG TPA: DUF1045 domain-containing protein [Albitalea sp.]|uniref:DUF1045 domain-containing protein n=1 Tax=Piscinibacter sp. TaxID=1903157 RepID=UPI002ED4ABEF